MPRNGFLRTTFCVVLAAASLLLIGATNEELAQRRQRIKAMTPAQKAELVRKQRRFEGLSPEKQVQLRELHRRLAAEPDGEVLQEVMWRYCAWLDTLLLYERNELEKLPADQRVERIKKERYDSQDARAIREWGQAYFEKLGTSPQKLLQEWRQKHPREQFRRVLRSREQAAALLVKGFRLEDADLTSLRSRLSPAAGKWFDGLSPEEQRLWVARALFRLMLPTPAPEVVSDEQLAEFLESKSVSKEDRERLMRLPGDEMHEELLRMYRRANPGFPRGGPGRRGPDWQRRFGPFGPPGEPRGERRDRGERPEHRGHRHLGPDAPPPPDADMPPTPRRDQPPR